MKSARYQPLHPVAAPEQPPALVGQVLQFLQECNGALRISDEDGMRAHRPKPFADDGKTLEVEGEAMRGVTWVTIHEVRSGDWGIAGQPLTTAAVKQLAAGKVAA